MKKQMKSIQKKSKERPLQLVDRHEEYAVPTRYSTDLFTLANTFMIYGCVAEIRFHPWSYPSLD